LVLPEGLEVEEKALVVESRETQNYVSMTIQNPMDNPFQLVSNAYQSLFQYLRFNRYTFDHFAYEQVFQEGQTEYMKICVAIQ